MMRRQGLVSATAVLAVISAAEPVALAEPPAGAPPVQTPQPAPEFGLATIVLTNGDTFHATIISDADPLVVDHPLVGRMTIPRDRIRSITRDGPAPAAGPIAPAAPAPPAPPAPPASPAPAPSPPASAPAPAPPAPEAKIAAQPPAPPPEGPKAPLDHQIPAAPPPEPSFLDLWKFSVEAGLNGTSGENNVQSFRALVSGTRPTPEMSTSAAIGWWYSRTNDETSAQRVQLDARNEWPATAKSTWSYFIAGKSEYDEFQTWDWRLSGQAGVGLTFFKGDPLTLTGRTGFGASREFGTPSPEVHAEFVPSVDLEYKINGRNKLCGSASAWIDLENTRGTHASLKAWYEAVLDAEHGMNLKIGMEDRYEASPGLGREEHEVDYYATIVFNF